MNLTFLNNLDDQQLANALEITKEAKSAGVSPYLALSVAYAESQLRQADKEGTLKSPKGALGLMQLMPSTAKELNVDPHDLNQNIKGGIAYLKQLNDQFGDPMLAAAAYNHGPGGSFFTKDSPLPSETKDYLKKIESYGGFSPYMESTPNATQIEQWETLPNEKTGYEIPKYVITAGGGAAGAGIGAFRGIKSKFKNSISDLIAESISKASAEAQPGTILAESGLPKAGGPLATTPAGGKGTMNWARAFGMADPEAMRARSMAEAHQMNKAAMEAENKIRGLFGGEGARYQIDPSRASLMINPEVTATQKPTAQMIRELIAKNPEFMKFLSSSARGLGNVLGGAGATNEIMEAFERYKERDPINTALSGISAVSGLASLVAPATISVAAPLVAMTGLGAAGRELSQLSKKYGASELERLFPLRTGLEQEATPEELAAAMEPYLGRRMVR